MTYERRSGAAIAIAGNGSKGREALVPAVPPFLRERGTPCGDVRVSLGCLVHGSHPSGPTWRSACGSLSSAGRSRARSEPLRLSRASTLPGSLWRALLVLVPFNAGMTRSGCGSAKDANGRRPSARRTNPTRGPPRGRAGKQLHLDAVMLTHHFATSAWGERSRNTERASRRHPTPAHKRPCRERTMKIVQTHTICQRRCAHSGSPGWCRMPGASPSGQMPEIATEGWYSCTCSTNGIMPSNSGREKLPSA